MDFRGNYRIEAVYFDKLKRNIKEAKRLLESGAAEEARFLLEDSVDVDGAVLLLYRNLGELWADLADKLEETKKALQNLAEKTEKYHDELNEKIDEINNYIMALIRALEERVTALETTVADHETRIGNLEKCCEDVQEAIANKQDKLTAGQNITIIDNVISAAGGGADNVFILSVDYDSNTDVYTPDKTYTEVHNAVLEGKVVLCKITQYDEYDWYIADRSPIDPPGVNSNIQFYSVSQGSHISAYDNKEVTLIYSYDQYGDFVDNTLFEQNPGIYGISAKVNNSDWRLSLSASSLFNKITSDNRCVFIQYLDANNLFNGTMEFILSAVQNGSTYEFKTNARTYTANSGSAYPVSPV